MTMANVERQEHLLLSQDQRDDQDQSNGAIHLSVTHENQKEQTPTLAVASHWWNECIWPGMGLFGESYLLFSIGTLKPIWQQIFPECFEGDQCSQALLQSLTYSVVLGVIVGMLLIGTLANHIGRRTGSILTASLMAGGAIGLTIASWIFTSNPSLLFVTMSTLLFALGIGVGGEYPLSASSASERAMGDMNRNMKQELEQEAQRIQTEGNGDCLPPSPIIEWRNDTRQETLIEVIKPQERGKKVQLVFTMQGMGILVNSLIVTFLLVVTRQFGQNGEYSAQSLLTIWHVTYAFGALILSYVLISRILYLKESQVWKDDKRRREQLKRDSLMAQTSPQTGDTLDARNILEHGTSVSSLSAPSIAPDVMGLRQVPSTTGNDDLNASKTSLLLRNYGCRLFGTSFSWFLWDIAFYGNKLFQSSFIIALTGTDSTLLEISIASTLNAFVALLGYFAAAAIIDHPRVGRLRLQQYGFLLTGAFFLGCGFLYDRLSSASLIILYLGSSFVGQCGPNATTFLIPAEIFPTEMRTMCHGIAAASGKVGALIAAIMFHHFAAVDLFLISGYASIAACVITVWTIPETTSLDLYETDRKWRMTLEGKKGDYEGAANKPEFMSLYERNKVRHELFQ